MAAEYPHKLTREAMETRRGCCGGHGHLCDYHEGFNDGVEAHERDELFRSTVATFLEIESDT